MIKSENIQKVIVNIKNWIKDYVKQSGADGVVVGNSGGKDSATVIALAVEALGKSNVITIGMPCNSVNKDLEDAKIVADKFNVKFIEIELTDIYTRLEKAIESAIKEDLTEESKINIKPRLRMTTLYAIAQTYNYLVIGTGNLCERMVGYTTKWGDSASDFNPIANFTVEEVIQIGEYLGVPEDIIKKSPSDGISGKADEERMGVTYKQISEYIETGKTDKEVIEKIQNKYKISKHKREEIPMYNYKRINYLEKNFKQ